MKTKMISLVGLFLIGIMTVFAQAKTEKIKVEGNCGMCKSRIEKAANSVEGVESADWNKETKLLEVSIDASKANLDDVHKAVAKAGHDTEKEKAEDKVYNALAGCCQYR